MGELLALLGVYRGGTLSAASDEQIEVAVVLGTEVLPGGGPSRTLEARVRHAARLYAQGRVRLLVPTGGLGKHPPPEAEVMARVLRKEGVPVSILENLTDLYSEISASFGQVAIMDNAPHPNAAKVFVNWLASKEGSEVFNRAVGTVPTRSDIDESHLPPEIIPKEGVQYFDTYDWEFTVTQKEKVRQRIKELLSAR